MSTLTLVTSDSQLSSQLAPLKEMFGLKLIESKYEISDSLSKNISNDENIVLIDFNTFKQASDFLSKSRMDLNCSLFIGVNKDEQYSDELIKLCERDPLVKGFINFDDSVELSFPLFRLALNRYSSVSKEDLEDVGSNIDELVKYTLEELQRVKKLHEKLVPMRKEEVKGLNLFSKFAAGESSSSEFYDLVKGDQELIILMTNAGSYMVSSMILDHFEELKGLSHFSKDNLLKFVNNLKVELTASSLPDSRKRLEMMVLRIDLKTLRIEGYNFGGQDLITNKEQYKLGNGSIVTTGDPDSCFFEIRLDRGEKLALLSPGVKSNSNGIIDGRDYVGFVKDQFSSSPKEAMNEIFFQLKRFTKSSFLQDDASIILLEVDSNVIVQV